MRALADDQIEALVEDFEFLEDWEDRYRYVIELGRTLRPLDEADRTDGRKVQGCASQVWLKANAARRDSDGKTVLVFSGDSDAHIVRGLIAILFALYSNHTPEEILERDSGAVFRRLGLADHLSPQRSNGLNSMVGRIREIAAATAASEPVGG